MSVIIDRKDIGKFLEFGFSEMGGRRTYRGSGIDDEGKELETWLKNYGTKNEPDKQYIVRVQDTKFPRMPPNAVFIINEIRCEWKRNIFSFAIILDTPK